MRSSKTAVLWLTLVAVSSGQSSTPQANPADPAARLPITRVILYKNGVGYFEHAGHVRGSQDVNVDFTTAQLNDVLKSLTVLDLGKGRITGVSYNSAAPLEKRLGSLRLPVGENPTTAQFLDALRGARVEIHSGSLSASGRLLSIEEREVLTGHDAPKGDGTDEGKPGGRIGLTQVSLVSDGGEVRLFDLTPATSVRVTEKDVNEEVGKYLGLVASTRDQDVRRMTISTGRRRRAHSPGQLHQRSAGVEEHVPHRDSRTRASLCCRDGPSSTTPSGKTGRMWNCRWSRARRSRLCRNSRSPITRDVRWSRCRRTRCSHHRLMRRRYKQKLRTERPPF